MFELHWAEWCVCSLTLKCCFHMHLLKGEGFSELTLNLSLEDLYLWAGLCDTTTSLEPIKVQYASYTSAMWKPETFEVKSICIFIDLGFLNEGERADAILRILTRCVKMYAGKARTDANYYSRAFNFNVLSLGGHICICHIRHQP